MTEEYLPCPFCGGLSEKEMDNPTEYQEKLHRKRLQIADEIWLEVVEALQQEQLEEQLELFGNEDE